jgi:hypothetical protein
MDVEKRVRQLSRSITCIKQDLSERVSSDVTQADLDHTRQALEEMLAELVKLFMYESVGRFGVGPVPQIIDEIIPMGALVVLNRASVIETAESAARLPLVLEIQLLFRCRTHAGRIARQVGRAVPIELRIHPQLIADDLLLLLLDLRLRLFRVLLEHSRVREAIQEAADERRLGLLPCITVWAVGPSCEKLP